MQSDSVEKAFTQINSLSFGDDFESFTKQIVEVVKSNIDCYFVGIFIMNEQKDALHLSAGSGIVGDVLVKNGLRFPVGNHLVKFTILEGDISLINGVTQEITRYKICETSPSEHRLHHIISESIPLPSPLLPDTKWHLFLPLQSQAGILGALEWQSSQEQGFEIEHILMLQELADVIALKLGVDKDG